MKGIEYFNKKAATFNEDIIDADNLVDESGDLQEISGPTVIIKNILRSLLIVQGTYLFDPEEGVGIQKYIFELSDMKTQNKLKAMINNAIYNYSGKANISYDIVLFRNMKGFIINFDVYYNGKTKKISVTINESLLDTFDDTLNSYIKERS